jgi:outer membrane protein OmpA-like peptidoglycan-associated protein
VAVTFPRRGARLSAAAEQQVLRPLLDAARGEMPDARLLPHGSTIHLDGYTDTSGTRTDRKQLSLRRANAIRILLQKHAGSRYRYLVNGHGARNPVASNRTAAGRQRNRRVEISYTRRRTSDHCNPGDLHCRKG